MFEEKYETVPEDHPYRCQAVTPQGQCRQKAHFYDSDGKYDKFCKKHAGKSYAGEKAEAMRNYQFVKYQSRINRFADNDQVKSLREEIGILRMIMEEVVNKCQTDNDILIFAPKITDLTLKIEKLVSSCHRLETSLGQTLDRTAILNLATRMVNIISQHISDQEIINLIVSDIGTLIQE
jgi:hypothetical protein